jgi:metal-responsive CopG/Arc/MetJ family transcriptional regulator
VYVYNKLSNMSRTVSGTEKRSFRLNMLFEPSELKELDDFRYAARIPSRSEAIRTLMKLGLEAFDWKTDKDKS